MTLSAIKRFQSFGFTENGAPALNTTGSALLDFFSSGGAMRTSSDQQIAAMFQRAFIEDHSLGLKLAFYTRDVRGGLGERRTGRIALHMLASSFPEALRACVSKIPEYGRWDDLLVLLDTPLEAEAIRIMNKQLSRDCSDLVHGNPVSLLAKWLPGVNASSRERRNTGRKLAAAFGMDERTYRHVLSQLRSYLNVTEVRLSSKTPDFIRYSEVPSCAMKRYRRAFLRNDPERFASFLKDTETGAQKINSSALFPYELADPYLNGSGIDPVIEAQWKALPPLFDTSRKFLVMADVSGSMHGQPMAASVGLALYFAERCTGPFRNRFMTFSERPELVEVKGDSLYERVLYARNADWNMNTDLYAALMLVLESAVCSHAPQSDLPESILVITDMEIDCCTNRRSFNFAEDIQRIYRDAGYTMPEIVFWNVSARNRTFLAEQSTGHVRLVSGFSVRVLEALMKGKAFTPWDYMVETLNSPRYEAIRLPD